ncbi:WhiB family transcriptional regulator [Nonomuraea typhae]|uniref:WhiB family transcriptional regulator n=1 Tax=Nonomuraea typhae TaxID=2603600 RepID=UPI0012F9B7BA|nr:WhiB family transcriptional regulator [Nonomuraea typhae]
MRALTGIWIEQAACLDVDPEGFFPISPNGQGTAETERAKAVCGGCPAREPCLTFALHTGQAHGVWGGTDPAQRRTITLRQARRRRTAPSTPRRPGR